MTAREAVALLLANYSLPAFAGAFSDPDLSDPDLSVGGGIFIGNGLWLRSPYDSSPRGPTCRPDDRCFQVSTCRIPPFCARSMACLWNYPG